MRAAAEWELWTTTARVVLDRRDRRHLPAAEACVREVTDAVDRACSRFRDDSELVARTTELEHGAEVSPLLASLVHQALDAARLTDGDVDPTLGNHMVSLGYDDAFHRTAGGARTDGGADDPDPTVLTAALDTRPAWQRVLLSGTFLRVPVASGSTSVRPRGRRGRHGRRDHHARLGIGALVSLGGDVATAGPDPAGGWQVRVQDLDTDRSTTSGSRQGGPSRPRARRSVGGSRADRPGTTSSTPGGACPPSRLALGHGGRSLVRHGEHALHRRGRPGAPRPRDAPCDRPRSAARRGLRCGAPLGGWPADDALRAPRRRTGRLTPRTVRAAVQSVRTRAHGARGLPRTMCTSSHRARQRSSRAADAHGEVPTGRARSVTTHRTGGPWRRRHAPPGRVVVASVSVAASCRASRPGRDGVSVRGGAALRLQAGSCRRQRPWPSRPRASSRSRRVSTSAG